MWCCTVVHVYVYAYVTSTIVQLFISNFIQMSIVYHQDFILTKSIYRQSVATPFLAFLKLSFSPGPIHQAEQGPDLILTTNFTWWTMWGYKLFSFHLPRTSKTCQEVCFFVWNDSLKNVDDLASVLDFLRMSICCVAASLFIWITESYIYFKWLPEECYLWSCICAWSWFYDPTLCGNKFSV